MRLNAGCKNGVSIERMKEQCMKCMNMCHECLVTSTGQKNHSNTISQHNQTYNPRKWMIMCKNAIEMQCMAILVINNKTHSLNMQNFTNLPLSSPSPPPLKKPQKIENVGLNAWNEWNLKKKKGFRPHNDEMMELESWN